MHTESSHEADNFYEEIRSGLLIHLWWDECDGDTPKSQRLCSWVVYKDEYDGRGLAWSSLRVPYSHALYNARKSADEITERNRDYV